MGAGKTRRSKREEGRGKREEGRGKREEGSLAALGMTDGFRWLARLKSEEEKITQRRRGR
jgi:hypothetical protein